MEDQIRIKGMKFVDIIEYVRENRGAGMFYTPVFYEGAVSYFFMKPEVCFEASSAEEMDGLFAKVEEYKEKGYRGYGYVNYEAYTEKRGEKIAEFRMFDEWNVIEIKSRELDLSGIEKYLTGEGYTIDNFNLNKNKEQYIQDVEKIKEHIKRGDTYQVNYTVKSEFVFEGEILSLLMKLVFEQSAQFTAFINNDEKYIISASPELFFERSGNTLVCKPMKGTEKRGYNIPTDNINKTRLKNSEKNKSENIMIVDLLRNDLSTLAEKGSVKVEKLFELEKYETLFQMTSTIISRINYDKNLSAIFRKLFPCGSITGAPKIRTMEIINETETLARGIYTGALGIVGREKDVFNVPIRTIEIYKENGKGEMGIGSGIVWESEAEEEFIETLLKSSFLTNPAEYFYLFETMLMENGEIFLLEEHMERLRKASDFFLFSFDEVMQLTIDIGQLTESYIIRLCLDKWGRITVNSEQLSINSENGYKKIGISDIRVSSRDRFQYFKTSRRRVYDEEYKKYSKMGFFDVVFFNERDELTEGSRCNIFLRKNDEWFTPEVGCGLLDGVYRRYFIDKHPGCEERVVYREELMGADEIVMTNSVRKEVRVEI